MQEVSQEMAGVERSGAETNVGGVSMKASDILLNSSGAEFSPDRVHRYTLWRIWNTKPQVMFVCLNPSTADETVNDATVERCVQFAYEWDFGGVVVCNVFALRSTNPRQLYLHENPIGSDNDRWIKLERSKTSLCVAAWGNHAKLLNRGRDVYEMVGPCMCFGVNKTGEPVHPLYLPRDAKLEVYRRG